MSTLRRRYALAAALAVMLAAPGTALAHDAAPSPTAGAPAQLERTTTSAKKTTKRRVTKRRRTVRRAVAPAAAPVVLAASPIAPAAPAAPPSLEDLRTLALATLAPLVDPAKLGVTVVFEGTHPSYLGLFQSASRTVTVYVRPGQSFESILWVLAHELGHAIDVFTLTHEQRAQWASARGFDVNLWWPTAGARSDQASGAGDFAESFAAYAVKSGLTFRSDLGAYPTSDHVALFPSLTAAGR